MFTTRQENLVSSDGVICKPHSLSTLHQMIVGEVGVVDQAGWPLKSQQFQNKTEEKWREVSILMTVIIFSVSFEIFFHTNIGICYITAC